MLKARAFRNVTNSHIFGEGINDSTRIGLSTSQTYCCLAGGLVILLVSSRWYYRKRQFDRKGYHKKQESL